MAMEQPMYATPVAVAMPDAEKDHRHIKEIAFVDGDGNPIDITGGGELADGSVGMHKLAPNAVTTDKIASGSITPDKLASYSGDDHGAIPQVKAEGGGWDFIMPSSVGLNLLRAATTDDARTNVGVTTVTISAEAVTAIKNKSQVKALTTLATDADIAATVQKVNQIIAALQA